MKIQFDSSIVDKLNLKTAEELLFFEILFCANGKKIPKYLLDMININTITNLRERGLIDTELNQTGINMNVPYVVRMDEYNEIDKQFKIFCELYPDMVIRPDGTKSYLQTSAKMCKVLYRKAAGENGENCELISDTLRREVFLLRNNGKMEYMRSMINWLKAEPWLDPEQIDLNDTKTSSYGQTFI
jgi:hypothetical protein